MGEVHQANTLLDGGGAGASRQSIVAEASSVGTADTLDPDAADLLLESS